MTAVLQLSSSWSLLLTVFYTQKKRSDTQGVSIYFERENTKKSSCQDQTKGEAEAQKLGECIYPKRSSCLFNRKLRSKFDIHQRCIYIRTSLLLAMVSPPRHRGIARPNPALLKSFVYPGKCLPFPNKPSWINVQVSSFGTKDEASRICGN